MPYVEKNVEIKKEQHTHGALLYSEISIIAVQEEFY